MPGISLLDAPPIMQTLDTFNKYIAYSTFLIAFLLELALFLVLRCNLDRAALVQLIIYFFVIVTRWLEYVANPLDKTFANLVRILAS